MSDIIKHECGVAMIRLLKPLEYYYKKYGSWQYGLNKLYLLMEKQHNRGQEAAGIGCIKLNAAPGTEYIFRERAMGASAIQDLFSEVQKKYSKYSKQDLSNPVFAKKELPFAGELYMGHLRYSTTGKSGISYVHPFLTRNNWKVKNLLLCGNFNMTNVDEMFADLVAQGQHPRLYTDTFIMLETLGHYLSQDVQRIYNKYRDANFSGTEMNIKTEEELDIPEIIKKSSKNWDGGYVLCGMTGSGDTFSFRDPNGIRPAFYYIDEECMVLASERPVIQTVMDVDVVSVKELEPGQAIVVRKNGMVSFSQIQSPKAKKACSFERIYFSRGSDTDIYRERKQLGKQLVEPVLKSVNYDLENTVFSFIPNTAEVAFFGMMDGMEDYLSRQKMDILQKWEGKLTDEELIKVLSLKVRQEKVAIKDIKLRTFITEDNARNDLATHVYDITYGSIYPYKDNLVVIDDSIVRGTTLKKSIIKILDRLNPRKIVIVSSSPQVRYPDCYGIDMSRMNEFIAFKAAIALLKETNQESIIQDVYKKSLSQKLLPREQVVNYVKDIYRPFSAEQISKKIATLLTPENVKSEVEIVYQSIEGLHNACPKHTGDWYFSGDYPTPGGNFLVNNAFINYIEGIDKRESV
ncbi:MAG: amidophosphoribosyltransferase [Candidatus Azobacteroides sp.]|nr:amidophosphoribosyltransferase [Candidatus Azobacteroides sp.]